MVKQEVHKAIGGVQTEISGLSFRMREMEDKMSKMQSDVKSTADSSAASAAALNINGVGGGGGTGSASGGPARVHFPAGMFLMWVDY